MIRNLVIYTAITGGIRGSFVRARVPMPLYSKLPAETRVVLITDKPVSPDFPPVKKSKWEVMSPVWTHSNPRRAARYHKLHPHILFPGADASVWIDGSQELTADPSTIFDAHMSEHDIATFPLSSLLPVTPAGLVPYL